MKKIFYSTCLLLLFCTGGCKKYIDVNQNPNSPTDVQESLILPPVEAAIAFHVHAGLASTLALHYTQAVALNQVVPEHGTYFLVSSELDDNWSNLFTTCLNNLKVLNDKATTNGKTNYAAIAKVLTAYCLGFGTDLWGDIPYSQALQGIDELTPVYDKQEDIYKSIQTLLDNAITDIGQNGIVVPGSDDLFYGGDMDKWKRLAYTLKARYYMHLTKAPGYTAAAQADLALTALQNGMESNDDDLKMSYPGSAGNENPWYVTFLPGSTLVLSSYTVETLRSRNDPRLPIIIAKAQNPIAGDYNGRVIGTPDIGDLYSYSIPGDFYAGAGANNYIVTYSEALFLKAEATFYKSGAAAAQPIYQDAIKSHMEKLGVSTAATTTYLTARGTLTTADALRLIMEEKNTADFLSQENFVDWRRTGFPVLNVVPNAVLSQIPRRLLYPQIEAISNPQAQQTAKLTDRVWWDQ